VLNIKENGVIRLSKSCLSNAEKQSVIQVLDREYLGMGEEVQRFEEELTKFFGRPAVCVVNGTAALHLSLQAAGIGVDDEVLVQSLTYIASFQAISATGARPVACDVNPKTLTIDCKDAEKRLTLNTKAIMPVHYAGDVGALDEIYAFAKKYNLRVIEDAAHAFGTVYKNKKIGSFGDIVCFSFDGIKNITSGEGGCIVTDDKNILKKIRDARLLGIENDTELRYVGDRSWNFDVTSQGWRYHMSDIMAAIGLEQLKRFSELSEKRRQISMQYDDILCKVSKLKIFPHDYDRVVPHIYVIQLIDTVDKVELQKKLSNSGVQTGSHYYPNHWLSLYFDKNKLKLPIVDLIYPQLMSLPLHPDLTKEDVQYVCSEIKKYIYEE
jgi:dTDP-4-amino-4,6-dideoxygalactose transaminase